MARHSSHPRYRLHKPSGRAVVSFPQPFRGKKDHYLGVYNSPESKLAYDRIIADWLAWKASPGVLPMTALTVAQVLVRYRERVRPGYRKSGKPTRQFWRINRACDELERLYGSLPAAKLDARCLHSVREAMIARGWARRYINHLTGCLKAAWDWATVEGHVPHNPLRSLRSLRIGTPGVHDTPKVRPVPWSTVEATLAHVGAIVADMVRVQHLADLRPCEVCAMRAECIDFAGQVQDGPRFPGLWVYEVPDDGNKNAHKQRRRVVLLGPKAQAILQPYLKREPSACLFSPREATEEFRRRAGRSLRHGSTRMPGERYTTSAYSKAIAKAAKRAGVSRWAPNQLRHARATEIRSQFGDVAARVCLGHALPGVTGVYAEDDWSEAARVMKKIG